MIPSRHMPPREVAKVVPGIVLWALLLGFAGLGLWVLGQAWLHAPLLGAGLTLIILSVFWELRRDTRRLKRFVRQRAAEPPAMKSAGSHAALTVAPSTLGWCAPFTRNSPTGCRSPMHRLRRVRTTTCFAT